MFLSPLRSLAALAFAALCLPVAAAEVKATAVYGVSLGGTAIATVTIRLNDSGEKYAMALDARVTGLAQLVASGTAKASSVGLSTGTGLVSQKFDLLTRASGEDFTVAVEYTQKDVTAFVVTPPILNNIDRVAIERKHLRGVNDMLAAFVVKGGALDEGLCARSMQVFTGVERFNLAMRFLRADEATSKRTGYQGPLVLCSMKYTPSRATIRARRSPPTSPGATASSSGSPRCGPATPTFPTAPSCRPAPAISPSCSTSSTSSAAVNAA